MVATKQSTDELVTAPEVARRLGLHPNTTRKLVRTGAIPSIKLGDRRYVAASVIDQLIARATSIEPRAHDENG